MSDVDRPPQPFSSRRRWLRWLGLLLLPVVLLFGYHGVRYLIARSDLSRAIAETDVAAPGWRLADLQAKRKQITPDKNAAMRALEAVRLADNSSWDTAQLDELFPQDWVNQRLNTRQATALADVLARNVKAIALARTLRQFSEGRLPIVYASDYVSTDFDDVITLQRTFDLLAWDVWGHLHAERPDEAADSCLALIRACDSIGDEPSAIAQWNGWIGLALAHQCVERVLAQGVIVEGRLQALQDELARLARSDGFTVALRGERAGIYQAAEELRAGRLTLEQLPGVNKNPSTWRESLLWLVNPIYLPGEEARFLRFMNRLLELAKRPEGRLRLRVQVLEVEVVKAGQRFSTMIFGRYWRITTAYLRHLALSRCVHAAVAAERYRLAHKAWPTSLQELVAAGFLAEVPVDPYDGQPLRVKKVPAGLVIYSVYGNEVDDDAELFRPYGEDAADIGVQLWDPAARRAEPLPAPPAVDDEAATLPNAE